MLQNTEEIRKITARSVTACTSRSSLFLDIFFRGSGFVTAAKGERGNLVIQVEWNLFSRPLCESFYGLSDNSFESIYFSFNISEQNLNQKRCLA